MKTPQRTEKLNTLGVLLVARQLNIQPDGFRFGLKDKEGKLIKVKVQNRLRDQELGDCFTVNVDDAPDIVNPKNVRLIFVDYDDPGFIRIYECTDRATYTMKNFKSSEPWKGKDWNRLMCCFQVAKMTLLHEVVEPRTLADMKGLSDAKKYVFHAVAA